MKEKRWAIQGGPGYNKKAIAHHPDYEPKIAQIRCRYCPVELEASRFSRIGDYESHVGREHPNRPIPPRRD